MKDWRGIEFEALCGPHACLLAYACVIARNPLREQPPCPVEIRHILAYKREAKILDAVPAFSVDGGVDEDVARSCSTIDTMQSNEALIEVDGESNFVPDGAGLVRVKVLEHIFQLVLRPIHVSVTHAHLSQRTNHTSSHAEKQFQQAGPRTHGRDSPPKS